MRCIIYMEIFLEGSREVEFAEMRKFLKMPRTIAHALVHTVERWRNL